MLRRVPALVAAILMLAAGLGVRAVTTGAFAKYAGVALYAALVYTLVVVLVPRWRPLWTAAVAVAFCWLVEFAQLTGVPADLSARSGLARLVLGSTFHPPDLFWYVVGVAATAGADILVRRAAARGFLGHPTILTTRAQARATAQRPCAGPGRTGSRCSRPPGPPFRPAAPGRSPAGIPARRAGVRRPDR